ncbi:MAG: peptidoglycan DD-metalloendopeptidase family protein [Ruminococcaceae bacterium]|nr:peptidoglycan DD-metalloendopeptidase family protein [Oscillospiraceae bacterium]
MKKIRCKKAKSIVLTLTLLCGMTMIIPPCGEQNVRAATSTSITDKQDKIKELQNRNNQIDNEIASIDDNISDNEHLQDLAFEKLNNAKDELDTYNNLLYDMEQDIDAKQADINALDIQIAAKEEDIRQKKKDIEFLEAENEKNLEKFGDMLHALYITENSDIFAVLSDSSDIYDLLVRTKLVMNVTEQNDKLMKELKQSLADAEDMLAQLEQDAADLETFHTKLDNDMKELEDKKAGLTEKQKEAQEASDKFNNEYDYYSSVIDNFEYRQSQLKNEKAANREEIEDYEKQIQREIMLAQQNSNQTYQQGDWLWPVDTRFHYITTRFGYDSWRNGNHNAIDIGDGGINGTNIYASKSGVVITAKDTYIPGYSYGKYIVIDHGDGYSTLYAHCSAIYVTVGQSVNQGDVIGAVGSTGWSTGPHLHFAVNVNGVPQDPFNYVVMP